MHERNLIIKRALEMDTISTLSDRYHDQRIVDGQPVTLRFLNQSIVATHVRVQEETGLTISESTFRTVLNLPLNKHIKTGRRERKTAVCRYRDITSLYCY